MNNNFIWREVVTVYREERPSRHGSERRWILNQETIENQATGEIAKRGTIRHPGISVIVPILDDERILLMRQYRYPAGEVLWELPAGTLNGVEVDGRMKAMEEAENCARRELQEETGYVAKDISQLGQCYAMPGSSDEMIHIFLARGLSAGKQSLDVGEVIEEVRGFPLSEVRKMIRSGVIRDAKTIVGLLLFAESSAGL
ncbi:MAG: NUDIX hydrolase [Acidobacteria bacterium]|nr:NUDIX hydrolase [Acidobacteriota bacterium]